jgi:hypothetical protein
MVGLACSWRSIKYDLSFPPQDIFVSQPRICSLILSGSCPTMDDRSGTTAVGLGESQPAETWISPAGRPIIWSSLLQHDKWAAQRDRRCCRRHAPAILCWSIQRYSRRCLAALTAWIAFGPTSPHEPRRMAAHGRRNGPAGLCSAARLAHTEAL